LEVVVRIFVIQQNLTIGKEYSENRYYLANKKLLKASSQAWFFARPNTS
jgi:hypothetical protein